jgi:regulator of sirC expression with transglutaminase-like and TPR domain
MGLPITLSVLGMEVGRRVGLRFTGIGMPGHFLLRHEAEPRIYVDPFDHGRLLSRDECRDLFRRVNGAGTTFVASYAEPVGPRAVLARILANLKAVYAARGSVEALSWVLPLRLAIPGVPPAERREWARVLGAGGRFDEAASELEELAEVLPDQSDALEEEALAFRARLN